jgi:RimJ/RimL family protein N-acetyltransferase
MLATTRLVLRAWRDDDIEPFAALNQDPEVMEFFASPYSYAESAAFVARTRDHFATYGYGLWAVEIPGVTSFAGFTGLRRPPWRPEVVEIGWRLARPFWGAGYATEAARAALAYGLETLGLEQIVSFVVPANVRSQAVMTRLGMTRDPDADFDHPMIGEGHPLRRHWLFRLVGKTGQKAP